MDKTDNQLKYENYREQFKRLNIALRSGFNLEAIFIEYAIMEDRTESILRHADKWEAYLKSRRGREPSIESKVRCIKKIAEDNKTLANKYFSDDLPDRILAWKEERNRLIHVLLKQQLAYHEVDDIAIQGRQLVDELKKKAGNFNRAADRRKAKETEL